MLQCPNIRAGEASEFLPAFKISHFVFDLIFCYHIFPSRGTNLQVLAIAIPVVVCITAPIFPAVLHILFVYVCYQIAVLTRILIQAVWSCSPQPNRLSINEIRAQNNWSQKVLFSVGFESFA